MALSVRHGRHLALGVVGVSQQGQAVFLHLDHAILAVQVLVVHLPVGIRHLDSVRWLAVHHVLNVLLLQIGRCVFSLRIQPDFGQPFLVVVLITNYVIPASMLSSKAAGVGRLVAVFPALLGALGDRRHLIVLIVAVGEFAPVGQFLSSDYVRSGDILVFGLMLPALIVVRQCLTVFGVFALGVELRGGVQVIICKLLTGLPFSSNSVSSTVLPLVNSSPTTQLSFLVTSPAALYERCVI